MDTYLKIALIQLVGTEESFSKEIVIYQLYKSEVRAKGLAGK